MKKKERTEYLKLCLAILLDLAKVMFAAGATIIFTYCFSESISPSGVKLTDAFPFFYVAFSFSIILIVGVIFGTYSVISILRSLIWIAQRFKSKVTITHHPIVDGKLPIAYSLILLTIFTILPLQLKMPPEINYWGTLLFFFIVGFFVLILFLSKSGLEQPITRAVKLGVLFVVTIFGLIVYHPTLMNITMGNIGMRSQPSDYILLDEKNYEFSAALANSLDLPFKACKIGETGKWVTHDLQIIWHGIGDKTFVRFAPHGDTKKLPGINSLYPLNRVGLDILRTTGNNSLCK